MEDAGAKLCEHGGHALAQRRSAAVGQPFADGQQCVSGKTRPLAATVDDGRTNAHFLALRVRGARRFSL